MKKQFSLKELSFTKSVINDYLNQDPKIINFQAFEPSIEGIISATEKKEFSQEQRGILVSALQKQLEELGEQSFSKKIKAGINKLTHSNTYTITTGQQLHPFLGPGYVIVKILETLNLCNHLNLQQNNFNYVPIFWLASEDHDMDEISTVSIFNKEFVFDFPNNLATGKIACKTMLSTIDLIEERLGDEVDNYEFFKVCKEAYLKQEDLSKATRQIIYQLFGEQGILVIDADEAILKKEFVTVIKDELQNESTTLLQAEVRKTFDINNWHYQVMPRTNNLFEIDSTTNERKQVNSKEYNKTDNYSPNALLRPLFQEKILPNVCYVGGMAEVNYWLQLKPVFDYHKIQMPVVWTRSSYYVSSKKKINKLTESVQEQSAINPIEQEFKKIFLDRNKVEPIVPELNHVLKKIEQKAKTYSNSRWEGLTNELSNYIKEFKRVERDEKNDILDSALYYNEWNGINKVHKELFFKGNFQERTKFVLELELNYKYIDTLNEYINYQKLTHGAYHLVES